MQLLHILQGKPAIILMDGADLMAILEERIDFVTLLLRKKTICRKDRKIYLQL